jgi:hypothetical protein
VKITGGLWVRKEVLTWNWPLLTLWVPVNDLPRVTDQGLPPRRLSRKTIVTLDWESFTSQRDADRILWEALAFLDDRVPNLRPRASLKNTQKVISKGTHDSVPKKSWTPANLLGPDGCILLHTAHVQEIERDGVLRDGLKQHPLLNHSELRLISWLALVVFVGILVILLWPIAISRIRVNDGSLES